MPISQIGTNSIASGTTLAAPTFSGTSTFSGGVANAYGFGVGTAVPSSGSGIAFPATQSASSDANTLDDYEEGTWTPVLTNFTVGNGSVVGTYTKVGDVVTIQIIANWGSTTSSGVIVSITGLPFAVKNGTNYPAATGIGTFLRQNVGWYTGSITANAGSTTINQVNVSGGGSVLSGTNPVTFANADYFSFSMTYKTST